MKFIHVRERIIFSIGLLFLISSLFLSCSKNSHKMYSRLRAVWTRNFPTLVVFDANNDGTDEIMTHIGNQIDVLSSDMRYYYKSFGLGLKQPFDAYPIPMNSLDSIYFLITYETNNTRKYDLLPPCKDMEGRMLSNNRLKSLMTFTPSDRYGKSMITQSLSYLATLNDKKRQWLFRYNTPWNPDEKRGIVAINPRTLKKNWEFLFGPILNNFLIDDFDKDGRKEIIITTYANGNGVKYNDITDDSSYVFALKFDGTMLWKHSFGSRWTGTRVASGNFEGTGEKTLFVYQYSVKKEPDENLKIFILDPTTGKIIKERSLGTRPNRSPYVYYHPEKICYDFNGDGKDEVVIGNTDGIIRMLNGNLEEINATKSYHRPISVVSAEDLNGDGRPEIIASIKDDKTIILDSDLNELCSDDIYSKNAREITIVHNKKKSFLLLSELRETGKRHYLLEMQQSFIPFPTKALSMNPYVWSMPFVFGIIFLSTLFFARKRWVFTMFIKLLGHAGLQDHIILIDKKDRIRFFGEKVARFFSLDPNQSLNYPYQVVFGGQQWKTLKESIDELLKSRQTIKNVHITDKSAVNPVNLSFSARYLPIFRMYSIFIQNIDEEIHLKQVKQWAVVAQKLAHGLKTPLTSLKLNTEELRHSLQQKNPPSHEESEEYFKAIITQIDRLRRMSDGFMRFVEFEKPNLQPIDINEKLTEWIPQWHAVYSQCIQLHWDINNNLPEILGDEKQLEYAFQNIFFNALESIPERGSIFITTGLISMIAEPENSTKKKMVEIQIQDTGIGIPVDLIDKIFDPYVTTKPQGTGLGLSIVKKIIDSHNGKIMIHSNKEDGTNVTVCLPINH